MRWKNAQAEYIFASVMKLYLGPLGTISFLTLSVCILLNVAAGLVFIFRRAENKRADYAYAGLLFAFALTAFHHVLILQDVYEEQPRLLFLPVYYTLSLGMLLFFSVKLRLFPGYRFVGSDGKHLILPAGQILYFLLLFLLADTGFRQALGRKFYSPFYGGLEMALYIGTFYAYLFGAYRYIRYKLAAKRHTENGRDMQDALMLRKLVRVMLVLFWVNSAYIVADFIMYELLRLNMHDFRGFTRFGELSFGAMAGWAGWIGLNILLKRPYHSYSDNFLSLLRKIGAKEK